MCLGGTQDLPLRKSSNRGGCGGGTDMTHNKKKIQVKLHRKTILKAKIKSNKDVPMIKLLVQLSVCF